MEFFRLQELSDTNHLALLEHNDRKHTSVKQSKAIRLVEIRARSIT